VTALWKERHALRLDLEPLTREDVASVLEAVLGAPVDCRGVDRFFARSGGNPLFVRELVDGALADGSLAMRDGLWQLVSSPLPSARLADLVEARLAGLDRDERRIVELLALGELLDVEVLAPLTSEAAPSSAGRHGLVAVRGDEVGLAYPIRGELVAARLGAMRSARCCPSSLRHTKRGAS
jgi:predicted ATPase